MASLADRIKQLRLSANMTQEEFGQKFGIVKSTVSLYENGKSTPNDQIKKNICEYFKISMDYLMGAEHIKQSCHEPNNYISKQEQQILNMYHQDPERITELLDSFSKLSVRNKTIVLGKCYELENEDEKSNTENPNMEKDFKQAT